MGYHERGEAILGMSPEGMMGAFNPNRPPPMGPSMQQQGLVDKMREAQVESLRDSAARLLQKLRSAEVSLTRILGESVTAPSPGQTKEAAEPGLARLLEECQESASAVDRALYRMVPPSGRCKGDAVMEAIVCYYCGDDEPMSDKMGWLELGHQHLPSWRRRFCGAICLNQWSTAALARLAEAVFEIDGTEEPK